MAIKRWPDHLVENEIPRLFFVEVLNEFLVKHLERSERIPEKKNPEGIVKVII